MRRNPVRWLLAVAGTVAMAAGLVALSAAPVRLPHATSSRIRLSWRARPEQIETCRTLSEKELEEREEHMRQRVECDGRAATYLLRVESDGRVLHESVARGGGLRNDRPLFILREIDVPPGLHRLRIEFTRRERTDDDAAAYESAAPVGVDTGLFAGRAQREATERTRRAGAAIPPRLSLDTTMHIPAGRTAVITFDAVARRLRVATAQ
jgi:hypothetical protein